jgi:hypothetical protein
VNDIYACAGASLWDIIFKYHRVIVIFITICILQLAWPKCVCLEVHKLVDFSLIGSNC